MYYLSAQPDDYYFHWQLDLQIYNFKTLGISPEEINVLIAYHPERGIRKDFINLMRDGNATFHFYPDCRTNKIYPSSIRPHIIKQHLKTYPHLQHQPIFYHDSDILFRKIPTFAPLLANDKWYVSDTRSYIDSKYIKQSVGNVIFNKMCSVVGIKAASITSNDNNAGGAQYLIKNSTIEFWEKVESDSTKLYELLVEANNRQGENKHFVTGDKISNYKGIDAWCADMWAVLWNAILFDHDVKISKRLDFCWPRDPIHSWEKTDILHYAGVKIDSPELFCKVKYYHYPPFYENLDHIDKTTCSKPIVSIIGKYIEEKKRHRFDLSDVTFIIPVRIDSKDRKENLSIILKYLNKYFDTTILVLEADTNTKIGDIPTFDGYTKYFVLDRNPLFHRTLYINQLVQYTHTPIICICDSDVILPSNQIIQSIAQIRNGIADFVSPYDGDFISVDVLFKTIFSKILDPDVLLLNRNKFISGTKRSLGGAVFLKTKSYIDSGLENIKIYGWGPDDVERHKRMKILGYKIKRIDGPLFHLHHHRGENSYYFNSEIQIRSMSEYIKVCNMRRGELKDYIQTFNN